MNLMSDEMRARYAEQMKKNQSGMGVGMQRKKKNSINFKRHGLKSDEFSRRIYPLSFVTQFNPFDLTDDYYNFDHKFVFPGSATTGFIALKQFMREDKNLLEKVCSLTGSSASAFNLDSPTISEEEFDLIKTWREPKCYTSPFISTQFSNRKDPRFSVYYSADVVLDDDGNVDESETDCLAYDLYKLESELIARRIAEIRESYETGENKHRSSADMKKDTDSAWKQRLISRPFLKYCMRYLHIVCDQATYIPCDTDYVKAKTAMLAGDMVELDSIKFVGYKFLETLKKMVGSRKDINMDFLEVEYLNPTIPASDKNNKGQYASAVTAGQVSPSDSLFNKGTFAKYNIDFSEFPAQYRNYLDDKDLWNDKIIKLSVKEFGSIDDKSLLSFFETDLSMYDSVIAYPDVQQILRNAGITMNSDMSNELMSKAFEESSGKKSIIARPEDFVDKQDLQHAKDSVMDLTQDESDESDDDFDAVLVGLGNATDIKTGVVDEGSSGTSKSVSVAHNQEKQQGSPDVDELNNLISGLDIEGLSKAV